jgi:hypothetical protein
LARLRLDPDFAAVHFDGALQQLWRVGFAAAAFDFLLQGISKCAAIPDIVIIYDRLRSLTPRCFEKNPDALGVGAKLGLTSSEMSAIKSYPKREARIISVAVAPIKYHPIRSQVRTMSICMALRRNRSLGDVRTDPDVMQFPLQHNLSEVSPGKTGPRAL